MLCATNPNNDDLLMNVSGGSYSDDLTEQKYNVGDKVEAFVCGGQLFALDAKVKEAKYNDLENHFEYYLEFENRDLGMFYDGWYTNKEIRSK